CGVLRTLPEMSENELAIFYPNDYWGSDPSLDWIRRSQADKTKFLAACNLQSGCLLDVGCGAGYFLRALDPALWEPFGVETGKAAAATANRIIGAKRIFNGTLIDSACEDEYFDVVTFWSALEHTNQPREHLIEARPILKARLFVPPAGSLRRATFLACIPFIKPFDFVMSAMQQGATLTIAARAT